MLPSSIRIIIALISVSLLIGSCKTDTHTQTTTDEQVVTTATDVSGSILERYFEGPEREALLSLKHIFEQGLRQGLESRPVAYAYEQHALRMKLDYFNDEPFEQFYPYNGAFKLSDHPELCEALPFFTKKCGFMKEETEEVINFWCLSLDDNFFSYLAELGKSSPIIARFRETYLTHKTILPDNKQDILISSSTDLQFSSIDHQLFYCLFHASVNAEYQATKKLKAE